MRRIASEPTPNVRLPFHAPQFSAHYFKGNTMKETYRMETTRFVVRSYGNGTAYCLTCKGARKEVFLQGDDANAFYSGWMELARAKPHWDDDGVLGELWLQYLDVATPVAA